MKVLASAFACQAVYAIYNQKVYDITDDGFSVSWEDSETSNAEFYKISVVDRQTQEEAASDEVGDLEAHFSSLASATVFDVKIEGWNGTASTGGQNQVEARTNGSGAWITGNWTTGAQGMVMWPLDNGESCGRSFNFMLPCDNIDMLDLGIGDNVGLEKSSNSSMAIYVGKKAHLSYIQWVALGDSCDWSTYTSDQFTVESFDGYEEKEDIVDTNVAASWSQSPGRTVNQVIVDIDESQRQDCAPQVKLSIPCEVTQMGGWSMTMEGGEFDSSSGSTEFVGTLDSEWINSAGFMYEFDDECEHEAVVSVVYHVRR